MWFQFQKPDEENLKHNDVESIVDQLENNETFMRLLDKFVEEKFALLSYRNPPSNEAHLQDCALEDNFPPPQENKRKKKTQGSIISLHFSFVR